MQDEIFDFNRSDLILSVDKALKYYTWMNKLATSILDAMTTCGLGFDYQFSTTNHGEFAVIHCPEYCWKGPLQEVSLAVSEARTAEKFWEGIALACKRQEYPWSELHKGV